MKKMIKIFKKHFKFNMITVNIIIGLISSIMNFSNGNHDLGLAWLFGVMGWFVAEINELTKSVESSICDEFKDCCIKYSKSLKSCNDELKFYKEEYFKVEKLENIEDA
jgi:hypothetical protein